MWPFVHLFVHSSYLYNGSSVAETSVYNRPHKCDFVIEGYFVLYGTEKECYNAITKNSYHENWIIKAICN